MQFKYLFIALLSFGLFFGCDVEQTDEGELPEMDVDVEEGELPSYEVNWADIDVGTRTKTVKVPDVRVVMEEEEVEVPYIDVQSPSELGDRYEQTLAVEAELTERAGELEIREVYATGDQLIVLAGLQMTDQALGGEAMRVSDQVVVNAPDMNVKYYIIGDKPARGFNDRYIYISDRNDIAEDLQNGKTIYMRDNG